MSSNAEGEASDPQLVCDLIRAIITQTENTPPPNVLIVESPAAAARLRALVGAGPHEPLHLHFGLNGVARIDNVEDAENESKTRGASSEKRETI